MIFSPQLRQITGTHVGSRQFAVSKVWAYIHQNGLQCPDNKGYFSPDATLQEIFGNGPIPCFAINSHLNRHIFWLVENTNE